MSFRFRILGLLIIACGLAFCHGALLLWPTSMADPTLAALAVSALHVAGAGVAAVIGVLNVIAGAVVFLKPARG